MKAYINSDIPAKVTVTTTAQTLAQLTTEAIPLIVNAFEVYADGGDIRYTQNPNNTPDATTGFVLADGETRVFVGMRPEDLKFRAGADTTMQIELGII